MKKSAALPEAFTDLEKFADEWGLATEKARFMKRVNAPLSEIRPFYDAIAPRADAMLVYLKDFGPDPRALPPQARTVLNLISSYFEVSRIFEVWDRQDVKCDFFPPEDLVIPV